MAYADSTHLRSEAAPCLAEPSAHPEHPELIEVRISTRDLAEAQRIADLLVEQGLAAGVNIVPGVHSVYRWKDDVCRHEECLLLAQTNRARFNDLEAVVRAAHSYETPNISAVPLCCVSPDFALWIRRCTAEENAFPTTFSGPLPPPLES